MGTRSTNNLRDCSWVPNSFEGIRSHPNKFVCTSDSTHKEPCGGYNCIAWALNKNDAWWWPLKDDFCSYWPHGLTKQELNQESVKDFEDAFKTEGYLACNESSFEVGFEKIALFVNSADRPTHAARQLKNKKWTSKLGNAEDIEHDDLECLEGKEYGKAKFFFKKSNAQFV